MRQHRAPALGTPAADHHPSVATLARIACEALAFFPPLWINSLFGDPRTWLPPYRPRSELALLDPRRVSSALSLLREVVVPGTALEPAELVPRRLGELCWRPSKAFSVPDHRADFGSFPRESWFFINGVATNDELARMSASLIAEMFHRPVTVIHNETNSLPLDLFEATVGRGRWWMAEPARLAYHLLARELASPLKRKVVVICHSQGTLIVDNALAALQHAAVRRDLLDGDPWPESPPQPRASDLAKLEIYAFANCAGSMRSFRDDAGRPQPWIESFGNENDFVARLGMLAPRAADHGIHIDGPLYHRPAAWGHLLNEHYLYPIHDHLDGREFRPNPFVPLARGRGAISLVPRLYGYYGGAPGTQQAAAA